DHGLDLGQIAEATIAKAAALSSDARFAAISASAVAHIAPTTTPPAPVYSVADADGTRLAEVKETARAVTFKLSKTDTPEFTRWLRDNAEPELRRLYETWKAAQQRG
ncbi:hypothetical protein LCGC14_1476810, partial [marine sediment metagenome]